MRNKILGFCICMLMMTTVIPLVGSMDHEKESVVHPETILPNLVAEWTQEQKLLTSDGTVGDCFGYSVSVDGDTALIGAFNDEANGELVGSAYVFIRSGTTWTQQAKLIPITGGYYDFFGYSVSLDGNTALIGAPGNWFTPVYPGAAYVFTRTGTTWTQQARLDPSDGQTEDYFGHSVSVDGDTAIIGSEYMTSSPGSVYVYTRSGSTWTQQTKIVPSDGINGEMFGYSVCLENNTALIGAILDDDNGPGSGSAYVYTGSGSIWTLQGKLLASDGSILDSLGTSVSLSGDSAVVGAEWDADNGEKSGSAYVFIRSGTTWSQQAKLLPADGTPEDLFGHAVSMNGDTVVIGAYEDDANGNSSGSAYIFSRSGATWTQQQKLLAVDDPVNKVFGASVSVSNTIILIGAYGDDENAPTAGAAYVFVKESINSPPNPPTITGPVTGKPRIEYDYTLVTTDPEEDQVHYFIDWGDGTTSDWVGPSNSGDEVTFSHTWSKKGTYTVRAKAKDALGYEGAWENLTVSMPYSFDAPVIQYWIKLLDWFLNTFQQLFLLV